LSDQVTISSLLPKPQLQPLIITIALPYNQIINGKTIPYITKVLCLLFFPTFRARATTPFLENGNVGIFFLIFLICPQTNIFGICWKDN
jgi:hypothetical protein